MEQFNRNEAISAVADEGFLGEEDEDYEDLYNDVNVGEGFFQSFNKKNEDSGVQANSEGKMEASALASTSASAQPLEAVNHGVATFPSDSSIPKGFGYQSQGFRGNDGVQRDNAGGFGAGQRVEAGQLSGQVSEVLEQAGNNSVSGISHGSNVNNNIVVGAQRNIGQQSHGVGGLGSIENVANESTVRNVSGGGIVVGNGGGGGGGGGGTTILFVGDLHWWTTDAELEAELCKYGAVKEVKFFDEKASGKSKGYCQVEFYDPQVAAACKEGMNGHVFNGRPCVVAFASPFTVKRMGEAQVNRNQQMGQGVGGQARRGVNDGGRTGGLGNGGTAVGGNVAPSGNYQGGDGNRGYGRGNWGRGNASGMGNRGAVGSMRNRPVMGGRGMMTNSGNGFGQGLGATPPMFHSNAVMGQGFDPSFGGHMGRMGSYGGFPGAPQPPFSGILSPFPPVGGVGLPGVAPHVNPAFFGRGMPMNGMGMMPSGGLDGPNMGMWPDPSMSGWGGEEHGAGRAGESSYGEEATSDHQYGEASHDRGGWQNTTKEKDRASSDRKYRDEREAGYERAASREKDMGGRDHEWSERRHHDDRDAGRGRERERDRDREPRDRDRERERERERDRDRYREDKDRHAEHHRHRDREAEHDDEWDRGRSSRTHSKSRLPEEDHRSRSREADYGKRRRLTSE